MYRFVFELGAFGAASPAERDQLAQLLVPFVDALAQVDAYWLRKNRVPGIYQSGVRYNEKHSTCRGCEDFWWDVPSVISHGYGKCEDLVAWRLAELWRAGVAAQPFVSAHVDRDGRPVYHVRVVYPDGHLEDPSVILGMR